MQKFIEFFKNNGCGFLATIEDNKPRVRPWSYLLEENGKFWFMTTNKKRVFKQLQENPNIEFCSVSNQNVSCRLSGKAIFNNNLEIKTRVLYARPMLKEIYGSAENPILETFYVEHGTISQYCSKLGIDEFIEF